MFTGETSGKPSPHRTIQRNCVVREPIAMNGIVQHLCRAASTGLPDRELVTALVSQRDEVAFEALVHRHGPMVLAVCRRALGNEHDAEDAFQATFLILLRKAAGIRRREAVASWLYGVA